MADKSNWSSGHALFLGNIGTTSSTGFSCLVGVASCFICCWALTNSANLRALRSESAREVGVAPWFLATAAAAAAIINVGVAISDWLATPPELKSIGPQCSSGSSLVGDSDLKINIEWVLGQLIQFLIILKRVCRFDIHIWITIIAFQKGKHFKCRLYFLWLLWPSKSENDHSTEIWTLTTKWNWTMVKL